MIERIGGTDLPEMDTSLASTSMITNEMNYNEILDRFTRNEIAYDDFMQLTGSFFFYTIQSHIFPNFIV
ncbi:unnamed protein product [Dracunculus medinensis]|uniref:Peroxidase n=1 Tax=Dracunculus medinensis TaxID=318479 RepID=A0A0N4UF99_DRAME|nr:unnamed protein product [Dracunculus medinensis]